jgi:hypothetical protein
MTPGNFTGIAPRVSAHRSNEVSSDGPVPIGRGDGLVCGLDSVVVDRYLLTLGVVRHQRLDDSSCSQTSRCETLHAFHKVAPTDLAVDKDPAKGRVRDEGWSGFQEMIRSPLALALT